MIYPKADKERTSSASTVAHEILLGVEGAFLPFFSASQLLRVLLDGQLLLEALIVGLNAERVLIELLFFLLDLVAHANLSHVHFMHVFEQVATFLSILVILLGLLFQLICPLISEHNIFALRIRLLHLLHVYLRRPVERLDVALERSQGSQLVLLFLLAPQVLLIARINPSKLIFLELCLVLFGALFERNLVVEICQLNLIQHALELDLFLGR